MLLYPPKVLVILVMKGGKRVVSTLAMTHLNMGKLMEKQRFLEPCVGGSIPPFPTRPPENKYAGRCQSAKVIKSC